MLTHTVTTQSSQWGERAEEQVAWKIPRALLSTWAGRLRYWVIFSSSVNISLGDHSFYSLKNILFF